MSSTTAAFKAECPYCKGQLFGLVDLVKDANCGLKVERPRIVVDTHLALSPECALAAWAPPARSAPSADVDSVAP